jgi:protein TonB
MLLACLATIATASNRAADEMTFDRYKGRIYALYASELKTQPKLKGTLVLDLKISADGRVADCRVVSNNVASPGFGDKVCERVREFQFAPRPAATTFTKEFTFFPAG